MIDKGILLAPEEKCIEILADFRWREGVFCPYCKSKRISKFGYFNGLQRHLCNECKKTFNVRTKTVFHESKIPLREWFLVMFLIQFKVSIMEMSKMLDRSYLATHRMVHKIMRSMYTKQLMEELKLHGEIEIDEMYISAGQKGQKCTERKPRKRGLKLRGRGTYDKDKPPIVALVERKGKALIRVNKRLRKKLIKGLLRRHFNGRVVNTDDYPLYEGLEEDYEHHVITRYSKEKKREYAKDNVHINNAENLFSRMRPFMDVHRGISKFHLHLYTGLFEFINNTRELNPFERLGEIVKIFYRIFTDVVSTMLIR